MLGTYYHFFRICGHKEIKTKLDDKPFGFPFDRELGFTIEESQR